MKHIDMIIDLQFGSTGKGLLAGFLARTGNYDTVMTAWGPNAGHTNIDEHGRKFVHIMLANAVTSPTVKRIMIGPGSILDLDILRREVESCMDILKAKKVTIYVHPHAAVVTDEDRAAEADAMTAIGSTKKGVGAALCSKIRRQPSRANVAQDFRTHPIFTPMDPEEDPVVLVRTATDWLDIYNLSSRILIEGAQGFGLSIHHGFYPFVTSRDITPSQILADCGVPFADSRSVHVYGTARTFPIRVANRFNEKGEQVGWSGPCYPDQHEIGWGSIGLQPELTTVTKLPRRLFTFSKEQMRFAVGMCSPSSVFLNFVNYYTNVVQFADVHDFLYKELGIGEIIYGTGPTVNDVHRGMWGSAHRIWHDLQEKVNV